MDINNQQEYWNKVASVKTFTHPVDLNFIASLVDKTAPILDFGCGYGRLTQELYAAGYKNIVGVDTSAELIKRGSTSFPALNLIAITHAHALPIPPASVDMILLFAVLTCIPSNAAQQDLIGVLDEALKPGGFLYISDYYLQADLTEVKQYGYFENDPDNYGVFTLKEGAIFRHHTHAWIKNLLQSFELISEKIIEVKTMNGHVAEAFQIVVRKS